MPEQQLRTIWHVAAEVIALVALALVGATRDGEGSIPWAM
jgi:hypothetical protein